MKYRKKPVEIEAMLFNKETYNQVLDWVDCAVPAYSACHDDKDSVLHIQTLEGTMTARVGDYIIKGVHGEFYPCKPDIFEETYEKVESVETKKASDEDDMWVISFYEPKEDTTTNFILTSAQLDIKTKKFNMSTVNGYSKNGIDDWSFDLEALKDVKIHITKDID